jgi:hypothetical protein
LEKIEGDENGVHGNIETVAMSEYYDSVYFSRKAKSLSPSVTVGQLVTERKVPVA